MSYTSSGSAGSRLNGSFNTALNDFPLTMSIWIKAADYNATIGYGFLLSNENATNNLDNRIRIRKLNTADRVDGGLWNDAGSSAADQQIDAAGAGDWDNVWTLFTFVIRSQTSRKMYVNGGELTAEDASTDHGTTLTCGEIDINDPTSNFSLAAPFSSGTLYAEACIWDTDLSDAQVAELWTGAESGPPANTVAPDNVYGYWSLRNGDGDALNNLGSDSGGDLTANDMATDADDPSIKYPGGSVQFVSADSEYYYRSASLSGDIFSMSCWIYLDDISNVYVAMCMADEGVANSYYRLAYHNGTTSFLATMNDTGGNASADSPATIAADTWYHVCCNFNGLSDRNIWVDGGNTHNNATAKSSISSIIDNISVGSRRGPTPDLYMNGRVFMPTVWEGYSLTADDAVALAGGVPPSKIHPESLILLNDFTGGGAQVDVISGTTLTPVGSPDSGVGAPHVQLDSGIIVTGVLSSSVVITDVDGDETWNDGSTGLIITGTGFR